MMQLTKEQATLILTKIVDSGNYFLFCNDQFEAHYCGMFRAIIISSVHKEGNHHQGSIRQDGKCEAKLPIAGLDRVFNQAIYYLTQVLPLEESLEKKSKKAVRKV